MENTNLNKAFDPDKRICQSLRTLLSVELSSENALVDELLAVLDKASANLARDVTLRCAIWSLLSLNRI